MKKSPQKQLPQHTHKPASRPDLPPVAAEDDDAEDGTALQLAAAALARPSREADARALDAELRRQVKQCLQKRDDDALYDALERVREANAGAAAFLREVIEDLAGTAFHRRGKDGPMMETNAFAIPLLVRSRGGLDAAQCFQDEAALDALRNSLVEAGLESRTVRLALLPHAYHPDEFIAISYSELQAMVRDAAASLTDKKVTEVPHIARSMRGWPAGQFGAQDEALELRFLLGFACKAVDDPFYQIPEEESAAEQWFDARAERYRAWTVTARPLVTACLAKDGRVTGVDFLYQDLFFGARAAGMAEYALLEVLAALRAALENGAHAAAAVKARIVLVKAEGETCLRVHLEAAVADAGSADYVLDGSASADEIEIAREALADGLEGLGIGRIEGF